MVHFIDLIYRYVINSINLFVITHAHVRLLHILFMLFLVKAAMF